MNKILNFFSSGEEKSKLTKGDASSSENSFAVPGVLSRQTSVETTIINVAMLDSLDSDAFPSKPPGPVTSESTASLQYFPPDKHHWEEITELIKTKESARLKIFLDELGSEKRRVLRNLLNSTDEYGMTVLHYAVRYADDTIARLLFEYGADPNRQGKEGFTPLHMLSRYSVKSQERQHSSTSSSHVSANNAEKTTATPTPSTPSSPSATPRPEGGADEAAAAATPTADGDPPPSSEEGTAPPAAPEEKPAEVKRPPAQTRVRFAENVEERVAGTDGPVEEDNNTTYSLEAMVELLLSKGADPNMRCNYGMTPLHHAALRGNIGMLTALLFYQTTDIDAKNPQGLTALHIAVSHGKLQCTRALLQAKANVSNVDNSNANLLHYAADTGNYLIIKELLTKDPSLAYKKDGDDWLPLHRAVANGHIKATQALLTKRNVKEFTKSLKRPLHYAAQSGNCDIIALLLKYHPFIDSRDKNLCTPLHHAAMNDNSEALQLLLENGARIEAYTKDSMTALLLSVKHESLDCVVELMSAGASLGATDSKERNVIYYTAINNNTHILKVILRRSEGRKQLNIVDYHGNSALHEAAKQGHEEVLEMLIHAGASVRKKNKDGETPLHVAARHENLGVIKLLTKSAIGLVDAINDDGDSALHIAAAKGHCGALQLLLDASPTVEQSNGLRRTALSYAAEAGHLRCCQLLIDYKAKVRSIDLKHMTPLHYAAKGGHVRVVELLLARNAHLTDFDHNDKTPLDYAMKYGKKEVMLCMARNWRVVQALRIWYTTDEGNQTTLMREIIKKFPSITGPILDRLISNNGKDPDDPDYTVHISVDLLDDSFIPDPASDDRAYSKSKHSDLTTYTAYDEHGKLVEGARLYSCNRRKLLENHPLSLLARYQPKQLSHPAVKELLKHKWSSYPSFCFYMNIMLFIMFLITFTIFVVQAMHMEDYLESSVSNSSHSGANVTSTHDSCKTFNINRVPANHKAKVKYLIVSMHMCRWTSLVLCCVFIIREFFKLLILRSLSQYLRHGAGVIEVLCYIGSILFVINFKGAGICRLDWQWTIGALVILFNWITLVLLLKKYPPFGLYVLMLSDVISSFINFFSVLSLMIVAFSLSFMIVFRSHYAFDGPFTSIITTSVMMVADMGYYTFFTEREKLLQHYPVAAYAIIVPFMIIMVIIVMNLVIGLAVDAVRVVQERAPINELIMKTQLVLEMDSIMPQFLLRRYVVSELTIKGRGHRSFFKKLKAFNLYVKGKFIPKKKHKPLSASAQMEEQLSKLTASIDALKHAQQELTHQMAELTKRQLKQQQHINYTRH